MPHNGHRVQLNFNFPARYTGEWWFLNHLKLASDPYNIFVDPALKNANGYPIDSDGCGEYRQFYLPNQTLRPGNYIVRWIGDGTVGFNAFGTPTTVAGSLTGVNGRYVFTPTEAPETFFSVGGIGITAINEANPITHLELFHEDDEELVDAGEIFNPTFLSLVNKFGVLRFMNSHWTNTTFMRHFSDTMPEGHISYGSRHIPAGLYLGATTNDGDAYSAAKSGFVLVDKAAVSVTFNATASTHAGVTLNVEGTGDLPVLGDYGDALSALEKPTINRTATLVYDEELGGWLKRGGDTPANTTVCGLDAGIPVSVCLRLCQEAGAHPWFCVPYLALDPPTDYALDLATYVKAYTDNPANDAAWMVPRYEPSNEVWNQSAGFVATRYAWEKAEARWAVSFDEDNWYGMVLSRMGETISDVYGDDRTKYQVICGLWTKVTAQTPAVADPRAESTLWVAEGGGKTPASDWATHAALTTYFGMAADGTILTSDTAAAFAYDALATQEEKDDYAEAYVEACLNRAGDALNIWFEPIKAWADGYGFALCAYEGSFSAGPWTANLTGAITAATKAAQCVLTFSTNSVTPPFGNPHGFPPVGSSVTIASVGGMTELNGNTYEVVSYNASNRTVVIDVDSTGFSNYTSGGTATFVDSRANLAAFYLAAKKTQAMADMCRRTNSHFWRHGGRFPSLFEFAGPDGSWSSMDTIYDTNRPIYDGHVTFSTSETPVRFTLRVAAE